MPIKTSLKTRIITICILLLLVFSSIILGIHIGKSVKNPNNYYDEKVDSISLAKIENKSLTNKEQIKKILNARSLDAEQYLVDSIYLSIPDISLIDILVHYGTSMNRQEIVREYITNYDSVYCILEKSKHVINYRNNIH